MHLHTHMVHTFLMALFFYLFQVKYHALWILCFVNNILCWLILIINFILPERQNLTWETAAIRLAFGQVCRTLYHQCTSYLSIIMIKQCEQGILESIGVIWFSGYRKLRVQESKEQPWTLDWEAEGSYLQALQEAVNMACFKSLKSCSPP